MNIKLLMILALPFMVHARTPQAFGTKTFKLSLDVSVIDDKVFLTTPSLTLDGEVVTCHCGKRATCIAVVKGKVTGLCIDHEEYKAVNPAHPDNWCVSCGSIAASPNIANKK